MTILIIVNRADASVHERVSKLMGGDLYTYIVGPRNKADVIPCLRHIPSSGVRFIKNTTSDLNGLLRSEFKRHKESLDPGMTINTFTKTD